MNLSRRLGCVHVAVLISCASSPSEKAPVGEQAVFPADYRDTYVQVRRCQPSGDHNLNNVRVLANPRAESGYVAHVGHFEEGDVVLKEEFAFGDTDCAGDVVRWTAMVRDAQSASNAQGWTWQAVDPDRRVTQSNGSTCIGCHATCGVPPDGYEGTCGKQ
jgi:hypothetical protein